MASDEPQPALEYEGAGAALEFAMWGLDEQLQTIKDIDAKAERALTLAVAILALFSGASTFQWGGVSEPWWLVAAAGVVLAIFLVAVASFFRCQEAANLYLGPDGARLLGVSADQPGPRTRQWMAEVIFRAVAANSQWVDTKDRRYKRLAAAVISEAIAASTTVVVATTV